MSELIGIVGRSGTGKTHSIQGLPPSESFIVSVAGKKIPMKGFNKNYTQLSEDGKTGNYVKTHDSKTIIKILNLIDKHRPEIKNIVLDDYQYLLAFEFFERADEKGFVC